MAESDHAAAFAFGDDVVEADECAAADEQDVCRIDLDVLLLGMLTAALWGNVGDGSLEHFEQGLLDALPRNVAGDRHIAGRLADFVDLVDEQYAPLGRFDIKVRGMQQFEQ